LARTADRKEGSTPQREQDGPRSQRRKPKGNGNPGLRSDSPPVAPHNRPDTGTARARKGADVGRVSLCGIAG
jgi:hypothetical protein